MLFHKLSNRYRFAILGALLSIGAPLGWFIASFYIPEDYYRESLYLYELIGTMLVFSAFGFFLGNSQDLLYKVVDQDHLTELLNQRSFFRRADDLYRLGIHHQDQMVMIMMDIDKFKKVNDTHGHLMGSKVLKDIAKIIKASLRETDLASRYGGDEFAICLPRTGLQQGIDVAERIRSKIEETTFTYQQNQIQVTTSLGVCAASCIKEVSMKDLIQWADQSLYKAKQEGRNKVYAETELAHLG